MVAIVINQIHPFTGWENQASRKVIQPATDDTRFPGLQASQCCRRSIWSLVEEAEIPVITSCIQKKETIVCLLGLW